MIGRALERLSIQERRALAGKWAAFEVYDPKTLPLRRIEALGDSAADCIRQLVSRGLNPAQFEFELLHPLY